MINDYKEIPMGRAKDLSNQRFGKLTVLYRTEGPSKGTYWLCQCDCGEYCIVSASHLVSNHTTSCGCHKKTARLDDISGQRYGRLTVLSYDRTEGKGHTYWNCQCDCGTIKSIRKDGLLSGRVLSCGCLHSEITSKLFMRDLTGQKIGKLTVIERVGSNKHNSVLWLCQCECGAKKIIPSSSLLKGESNSCGCIKSKGEWKIAELLTNNNIPFQKEYIAHKCILPSQEYARFDFYVENKYFIEFDGIQHFQSGTGWNTPEKLLRNQMNDTAKNEWCKANNIPLIRIKYDKYDTLSIEDLLLETSKFIVKE